MADDLTPVELEWLATLFSLHLGLGGTGWPLGQLAETMSTWRVHQLPGPLQPFQLPKAQVSVLPELCKRIIHFRLLNGAAGAFSNCLLLFWKESSLSLILQEEVIHPRPKGKLPQD